MADGCEDLLKQLERNLDGDLYRDRTHRVLYATDASVYRQVPLAVACPRHEGDLQLLVDAARDGGLSLVPRGGGTSLAGQAVGPGVVVDFSRWMNRVLSIDASGRRARVQPGVIRDVLNRSLAPEGLFFAPETSTTDRCTLGGMVGNNACGLHSLRFGSTREHVRSLRTILADGSIVFWSAMKDGDLETAVSGTDSRGRVLDGLIKLLSRPEDRRDILAGYPHPDIPRRNTGYALDLLARSRPFEPRGPEFDVCRLLCGSEGTLALVTEIEVNLQPLPPLHRALVAVHLERRREAYSASRVALALNPDALEMMDHHVLRLAAACPGQRENLFFIRGNPGAVLLVEFTRDDGDDLRAVCVDLEKELRSAGYGSHFPVLTGAQVSRAWDLRRAGLGVLNRMPGPRRPVSVMEDTAVRVADLPAFMEAVETLLGRYGLECVVHAHVGSGELHLRPILDMHDPRDVERFAAVGEGVARLVAGFRGSLSGEHGDGRLRAPWIPLVLGEANTRRLEAVKDLFDPRGIFNPGKIVRPPPVAKNLRTLPGSVPAGISTVIDFSGDGGLAGAAERCSGSGECRREAGSGGAMCPSYRATREELHSTRGRANLLREFLVRPDPGVHPLDHAGIGEAMDLCLSCKACRSECPSGVDMARMKAEWQQREIDRRGAPLRVRLVANYPRLAGLGMIWPALTNFLLSRHFSGDVLRRLLGFSRRRPFPVLSSRRERRRLLTAFGPAQGVEPLGRVLLLMDEFTLSQDARAARAAVILLRRLGFSVAPSPRIRSGRTLLSSGFLRRARVLAERNLRRLEPLVSPEVPLVGIEPSTLLVFRDEYPDLLRGERRKAAEAMGKQVLLFEEFLDRAVAEGRVDSRYFTREERRILYHGHCHTRALVTAGPALRCLSLPPNFRVEEVGAGCCGMGGVFGYEKDHYPVSMRIGEEVLFPIVRAAGPDVEIVAGGTGCRQQILDGTGRPARHPAEVLLQALLPTPRS